MNDDKIKDPIADALELVPLENTSNLTSLSANDDQEYEYIKNNIEDIISTGSQALNNLAQIASVSQQPRAYEALTELIKAMVQANRDLIEVKKINSDIQRKDNNSSPKTVNQNLFVGSTQELIKMLKDVKDE